MITDWMEKARCVGHDEEKFFDKYLEDEDVAVEVYQICRFCPVKVQCLNYGKETKSCGIWGGRWLQNGKPVKNKELVVNEYFWR